MRCSSRPKKSFKKGLFIPFLFIIIGLFSIAACTKSTPTPSSEVKAETNNEPLAINTSEKTLDNPKRFRGLFSFGHEVRSFTLCGQSEELWVIDKTQGDAASVSRDMTTQPYQAFFVEVEGKLATAPLDGFGSEYSGAIIFDKLIHASRVEESWGCREQYETFIFKAQGNEPGWTIVVSKNGIKFSSMNHESSLEFPLVSPVLARNESTYETSSINHTLRIALKAEKCFDTMSGERFGWKAEVSLDGKSYLGCAKQGDQLQ